MAGRRLKSSTHIGTRSECLADAQPMVVSEIFDCARDDELNGNDLPSRTVR